MVADYTAHGDSFVPEKPRLWWKTLANTFSSSRNVDIAPDGKRFVVLLAAEGPEAQSKNQVIFLENFFDELRRRAPVKR